MTAEERILSYLDGSLSESESAELLHELSVSPEKRVVLEQHLKLTDMTRAAQKPFEVPAELEEKMRRRLPLVIPSESIAPTVLRRGAISSLLLLLRGYPMRFAIGSIVLLLGAAGAYLLSNSNSNNGLSSTQLSQNVQNAAPTPKAASTPAVEPKNNAAPVSGATSASPSTTVKPSTNPSVETHTRGIQSNQVSNHSASNRSISNHSVSNNSSSTAHRLTRNSNNVAPVKEEESQTNTTSLDRSVDHSTSQQATPVSSSIGMVETAPILSQPVASISQSEIRERYRLNPLESKYNGQRSPWAVRVSLGYAETFLNVSSGENTYTARLEGMPFVGVNYSLGKDQTWAIGAVIGKSSILTVSPQTQTSTVDGVTQVVAHTYSTNSNEWLARLAARYTFHVVGNFKGEASVEAGALLSSMSPMASIQLLAAHSVTDAVDVQFGFLGSGVWTTPEPIQVGETSNQNSSGVTAYRTKSIVTQSKIFSPAITFRAGLQYRF